MFGPFLGLTLCVCVGSFFGESLRVAMGRARGWAFVVSLYLEREHGRQR